MKPELRKLVYDKYNGCCAYCGCEMTFKEMQVDHLVSKLIFSLKSNFIYTDKELNDIDNLMPSCRVCNKWKSAHSLEQFRKEISQQLKRLNEYNANFRFAKKYGLIQETPKDIIFHFEKK